MRLGDLFWTDENVETLKALWNQGKSASEIAIELGVPGENNGRSAVLGKIHRLKEKGWTPVQRTIVTTQPKELKPKGKPGRKKKDQEEIAVSAERPESFLFDFKDKRPELEKKAGRHVSPKKGLPSDVSFRLEEHFAEKRRQRQCMACGGYVPPTRALMKCDACISQSVGTDRPFI